MSAMAAEVCGICGGDGRISSLTAAISGGQGSSKTCPSCNGTGRRKTEPMGLHDVTKTKPSHYTRSNKAEPAAKQTWPTTAGGEQLATEVQNAAGISNDTKARLVREIIDYEGSHGACTQTFTRKVRKQLR